MRAFMALIVIFEHIGPVLAPDHWRALPAHEAVVVFFVLSGYVIAFAAMEKEKSLLTYAFNRFTRIWSVALPALLLGGCLTIFVHVEIADAFPVIRDPGKLTLSIAENAMFLAQIWSNNISAPLNSPYWSLNYEVWYYAIFGIWLFVSGSLRWLMCGLVALVAGPKIAMLFPCWALGVLVYWYQPRIKMSEIAGFIVLLTAGVVGLVLIRSNVGGIARTAIVEFWPQWYQFMGASNKAPSDFLFALCFAASIFGVASSSVVSNILLQFARPIRWAAKRTLSGYLFHAPIFAVLYATLGLRGWVAVIVETCVILLLAELTELRLGAIRRWLTHKRVVV